ncbi:MAG: protein kinase [Deltaproteobacteria bacterium]|nr:protein kinase [Deltaproteobacteria bacterium]
MQRGDEVAGRFQLEELAGTGGMGAVFRAHDRASERPVALKVAYGESLDAPQRLAHEAELLAELADDRVVAHVAHGRDQGVFYLALEWLQGEDLDQRLEQQGLTLRDSLLVAREAALALAAIHGRGLVHRDVKPANLFLVERQSKVIKLLDFGVALRVAASGSAAPPAMLIGTPAYMSPEQAGGESRLTAAVDVYALGCVLFECLTGRLPHEGDSLVELLTNVFVTPVPLPSSLRPDIPTSVDALVMGLLSRQPDERPTSDAVAMRLGELLSTLDGPAPIAAGPTRSSQLLMEEERRVVSVLVMQPPTSTLTATTVTTTLDDLEDWLPTARLREVARAFGARAERIVGVGVLVVPEGTADSTERLARCALALAELAPDALLGLATHRAVVSGGWPFGEAVETAIELAANAGRGVLVDETTARLAAGRLRFGATVGKGHRLQGLATPSTPPPATATAPMVGRDGPFTELKAALQSVAATREPLAVIATGDAGMGKSRLARELMGWARSRPILVCKGRADPMAVGSPYALAGQSLRGLLGIDESFGPEGRVAAIARRCAALGIDRSDWQTLEEQLGLLLDLGGDGGRPTGDSLTLPARADPRVVADAIRSGFVRWMRAEAEVHEAILVVLDDLHWGDFPSVRLFDKALEMLSGVPLMVLALARPDLDSAFPDLWAERAPQRLLLEGLAGTAAAALVRRLVGAEATDEQVSGLVARGAGNPFYLSELARAAQEGRGQVPESVLALVQRRLDRIAPEARRLLRAASVFGEGFHPDGVLALLGADHAGELSSWLPQLEAASMIEPVVATDAGLEAGYCFHHALLREAAYATLPEGDRPLAHHLAAAWLERQPAPDALAIAEQWRRSNRPDKAAGWYEQAARRALTGHDFDKALELADQGIAAGAPGGAAGKLHLVKADVCEWATDNGARERAAAAALKLFEPGSDLWLEAFLHAITAGGRLRGRDAVEPWCDVLDAIPFAPQPRQSEVIALARASGQLIIASVPERGRALLARAEGRAAELGEVLPTVEAWLAWGRAWAALAGGDIFGAYQHDLSSALAFERADDVRNACHARSNVGYEQMGLGLYEQAAESLERAREVAIRLGLTVVEGDATHNLGMVKALLGDVQEGLSLERQAHGMCSNQHLNRMTGACDLYLARIHLMAGDLAAAERWAREAIEAGQAFETLRVLGTATLARTLIARGYPQQGVELAREAYAALEGGLSLEGEEAYVRTGYLEALEASGDRDGARAVTAVAYRHLMEAADRLTDSEVHRAFLRRVPEHAAIVSAAARLGVATPAGTGD